MSLSSTISSNGVSEFPLISVAIASRNQGKFIEETLLSIFNQSYQNFEVLVADAVSTDNTHDVLKKYEATGKLKWKSEPDNGPNSGFNKALGMAKGEILVFQCSSDTFYPGTFQKVVHAFRANPKASFVGGAIQVTDEQGFATHEVWGLPANHYIISKEDIVSFKNIPGMPASYLLKSMIENLGGRSEQLQACHSFFFLRYLLESTRRGMHGVGKNEFFATFREHALANNRAPWVKGKVHIKERHQACRDARIEFKDVIDSRLERMMRMHCEFFEVTRRIIKHRQVIQTLPALVRALFYGASLSDLKEHLGPFFRVLLKKLGLYRADANNTQKSSPTDTRWYLSEIKLK